jgi:hypothetical protein
MSVVADGVNGSIFVPLRRIFFVCLICEEIQN